ncbi:hypothetical protein [Streptomyces sp. NPDC058953]|uniref:hypothetical protein n=1 Tax=unclassified Streptomyces TaxID=2593676 RepID=UPI0036820083
MRDSIAHTFARALVLPFSRQRPGRHTAAYFSALPDVFAPPPESPWSRPWTGPEREQAREFFRTQSTVLDCLLAEQPPATTTEVCLVCSRETAAPVEVRPGLTTCPTHILDAYDARTVAR